MKSYLTRGWARKFVMALLHGKQDFLCGKRLSITGVREKCLKQTNKVFLTVCHIALAHIRYILQGSLKRSINGT